MRTERTMELLREFEVNGIACNGKRFELVLEYQDCIMQSTNVDIKHFESSLDSNDRKLFFWVNANCLSMDSFLDILRATYISRKSQDIIDKGIEREDERYSALFKELHNRESRLEIEKAVFAECKKPIHKKINDLRKQLRQKAATMKFRRNVLNDLQAENKALRQVARQNEEKAQKYDDIKNLLK